MSDHCIEIVVYKVKDPKAAAIARRNARPCIESQPGFLGWQALTATGDPALFTDIVTWASLAEAKAAGRNFATNPGCAPLLAEIDELVSMGHFA
jgi:heme-degrading monooxygenase HmoA